MCEGAPFDTASACPSPPRKGDGRLREGGGRAHASRERSTPLVNQNASDISTYQVSYLLHPLHPSLSHIAFLRISHHPFPHFPPTHTLTHKSLQANE